MSEEKLHRDFEQVLGSFLSGELSGDELSFFQDELRRDPAKQKLLDEYRLIWEGSGPDHSYDLDAEWALLQKKLPGFETKSRPALLFYTYRIAAVLVLGLVLTFSWIYMTRMMGFERVVAENEAVAVILEDGTEVIVNRHSSLKYRRSFDGESRKVYLSGEAWFDVARDTTLPFFVDAGTALVKVLGTSFNVNAYKENPTVEITVESGLVAMSAKEDEEDLIVMKAGSGGSYHKSHKELKLIPTADPNSISWKTRELFFQEATLQEVTALLNSVYDVNIVIMNQALASCPITVTFNNQTIEAILNVLELTLDLQVTRMEDKIRIDGDGCLE